MSPLTAKQQREQRKNRINSGICTRCGKNVVLEVRECDVCKTHRNAYHVYLNKQLKLEVLTIYGGKKCACCGETELSFLSIDHINGGGEQQRKKIGSGTAFYRWLRHSGYPEGFQVLCHNCNHGKHINGGICPHQQI